MEGGHTDACVALFQDKPYLQTNGWDKDCRRRLWARTVGLGHERLCRALVDEPVFEGEASSMHIVVALLGLQGLRFRQPCLCL